jgi:UDP-N-acetylglucosamine 2-epimerase (non-hydrolysing)
VKVVTIFGTRPEIIRLSVIIDRLDRLCDHTLIHTGQNFDEQLSDVFFTELGVRQPDLHLGIEAQAFGEQVGRTIRDTAAALEELRPDRLLILGDTNSGLAALPASRLGIPVFHLEAGNRCFDDRVPEEINRRVIDHCSTVLMPYTYRSKENLLREGIERQRIFVTGNPIYEVLGAFRSEIEASGVVSHLGLDPGRYILVTAHRAENVDDPARLEALLTGLSRLHQVYEVPVVVSLHPRTAAKIEHHGITVGAGIMLLRPLGLFDFVALEQRAMLVVTDSGTVQEECCIFGIPNITARDTTERPETLECGSNILAGVEPDALQRAAGVVLARKGSWSPPPEYLEPNVSATVANILLGYLDDRTRRAESRERQRPAMHDSLTAP